MQVGAVIVSSSNVVITTGYNGPPAGFDHRELPCLNWCLRAAHGRSDANYSTCPSIHAEANALLSSERSQRIGGTIYVSSDPCWDCGKLIANSGLSTLVVKSNAKMRIVRDALTTYAFLEQCGIQVILEDDE
jgi:dCMP deaminase